MQHFMNYLLNSGNNLSSTSRQERRKSKRVDCSIKANYMVKARWHQGSIQNISDRGAYITPIKGKQFSPGEEILLVARIRVLRDQIRDKIAWLGPHGMGIEFNSKEPSSFIGGL
jgi:hypothetical protein